MIIWNVLDIVLFFDGFRFLEFEVVYGWFGVGNFYEFNYWVSLIVCFFVIFDLI